MVSFNPRNKNRQNAFSYQDYPYYYEHDGVSLSGTSLGLSEMARREPAYKSNWITLPDGTKFRTATWWVVMSNKLINATQATMSGFTSLPATPYSFAKAVDISYAGFFLNLSAYSLIQEVASRDMRNEAVTKAMNKIADQKVNLGENLATLKQTYGMFQGKASLLRDALVAGFRKKAFRPFLTSSFRDLKRKGVDKVLAEQYLQYIYGLVPLMSDIYEVAQLIKGQGAKPLLLKGVGVSYRQKSGKAHNGVLSSGYASVVSLAAECNSKCKCTLWARLDPKGSQFRLMNQLGLLNPLSLAYELTPWSFVVDWFLPIGQVLSALTAPSGLIFVDGSIAFKHVQVEHEKYAPDRYSANDHMLVQSERSYGELTFEKNYYRREPLSGWPLPGLWLDGNPLRGDRGYKALALSIANLGTMRKSL